MERKVNREQLHLLYFANRLKDEEIFKLRNKVYSEFSEACAIKHIQGKTIRNRKGRESTEYVKKRSSVKRFKNIVLYRNSIKLNPEILDLISNFTPDKDINSFI